MQLFGNDNKKDTASPLEPTQEFIVGRISGFHVAILSKRADLVDKIRSILFLYNILSIDIIPLELSELKEDTSWRKFDAIIFDIADESDAEQLSETINRYIPITITTILVGNYDSIVFSELLLKKGIHFILENKQLEKIPSILHTRSVTPPGSSQRVGSVVTFLACKGGIGTSSLVVHTLKNISHLTNYPILYIQGVTTSPNADFLFEHPIAQDGSLTNIDKLLQVKVETNSQAWNYNDLNSGQFNISVIEQNMGLSSSFGRLEEMINLSNIIFIVINRDPYAVKVAKSIFEEIARASLKNTELLNKRFLVCLNENVPYDRKNDLQDIDIEEFIGRKIDLTRKYIANSEKFKKAHASAEISAISSAVIGDKKAVKQKKNSIISSLLNRKRS